jgi:predicted permease
VQNRPENTNRFQSEGGGITANGRESVFANVIGPQFFRTLGITLSKGRDFSNDDIATGPPVAIVSDAFARKQFTGENAVGQRLSVRGPNGPWIEIVGVVADSKYATLNERPAPVVYLPLSQNHESGMVLFVRATSNPEALSSSVRQVIQKLEPNLPVPPVQPMSETVATSIYPARMGAGLLTVFGALALLLASVGIYGVLAFLVSRRTREMGIRVALGASRRDVFALVVREGLILIVIGAVIGVTGAAFGVKWISTLLYGVETRDALTFAIAPVVLVLVGLLACLLPARRAMRVDPTVALKSS